MIAIVDTGGANIASVKNALARLNYESELTADPKKIEQATHVILPGVGAAGAAMERIHRNGLFQALKELKRPTLGICLGMQILFERSTEGDVQCLGIFDGTVQKLVPEVSLTVPHMGWNRVNSIESESSKLLFGIPQGTHFYFVHSYVAPRAATLRGVFEYGGSFPALVEKENFFGVQFHPERSGVWGERLLTNFLNL